MERSLLPVPVRVPPCRIPLVHEEHELFFQKSFSDDDVKSIAKEVIQLWDQLGRRHPDIYLKVCWLTDCLFEVKIHIVIWLHYRTSLSSRTITTHNINNQMLIYSPSQACIKFPKGNVTYNCLCGVWLGTKGKRIYTRLKRQVSLESARQKKSKQKRAFSEITNTLHQNIKAKVILQRQLTDQGKLLDQLRVSHSERKIKLTKQKRKAESAESKIIEKDQVCACACVCACVCVCVYVCVCVCVCVCV